MKAPGLRGPLHPFSAPHILRHRLPNGFDIWLVRKSGLPVVELQLLVRGGGVLDGPEQAGRASLLAELLDEGTQRYGALELSDQVELLGASLDLQAGWDVTVLAMHGLASGIETMLDLMTEVSRAPVFPQEEFERKHKERLYGLAQERDEPRLVAAKAAARAVFGSRNVYGWPLGGTLDTVATLDRAGLNGLYAQSFAPARSHFIVVGDVDEADLLHLLETRFGDWSGTATVQPQRAKAPAARPGIYLIDRPDAAQSEVRVGHVGPARSTPDYFPLLLMNTVLGGSFNSRLNMVLREEKGFTYGASSAFAFRRAGGLFSAGSAVYTDNTAETVSIFLHELRRMQQDGVTAEELERARRYNALGFVRMFETTSDIASHLADMALYDLEPNYLQNYAGRIASVTQNEVADVARSHLRPQDLAIVVVGDRARVRAELDALDLGPVQEWEAE